MYIPDVDFPVDMAWVEGTDTIFFTEKSTGNVRIAHDRKVAKRPCVSLNVDAEGERGALGITLDPDFDENRWLYVYYTNADPLENRVTRFTVRNDRCTAPTHVVTGLEASSSARHNGGQLEAVGRYLYVSVGDGYDFPERAQDTSIAYGKILRYELDGDVPPDNPFGKSPVWAFGFRNPFGLAYDEERERLYATENGPSCDDEVNVVLRGRNYGWGPGAQCGASMGPRPKAPLFRWTPTVAPTDAVVYRGSIDSLEGELLVGDFNFGGIHRFTLDASGKKLVRHRMLHDFDRQVADVTMGPGRHLYVLTIDSIKRFVARSL